MKKLKYLLIAMTLLFFSCRTDEENLKIELQSCKVQVESLKSEITSLQASLELAKKDAEARSKQYFILKSQYDELTKSN